MMFNQGREKCPLEEYAFGANWDDEDDHLFSTLKRLQRGTREIVLLELLSTKHKTLNAKMV